MTEIEELIPHRPPFLLVSEIVELVPAHSARGRWHLTGEEEFFAGHFPKAPVLPGVLMVESLAQLAAAVVLADERYKDRLPLFGGIDRARFRCQVGPGDTLDLEVTIERLSSRAGSGKGVATLGGKIACEAEMLFALAPRRLGQGIRMRVATWNVNSMKARLERVVEWLKEVEPDVCCFQETKLADDAFPTEALSELGYEIAHHGDGRWNGVAIASRVGLSDLEAGFAGSGEDTELAERRLISATCNGVRVMSVYVPNGRAVESEHFVAKLEFLRQLHRHLELTCDASGAAVLCGDFNVAPQDIDVFDPAYFIGATHVTPEERAALSRLTSFGLSDVFRASYPDTPRLFSWWDYRAGDFHSGRGMRIDLVLATRVLADRVNFVLIDRNARKGKQPSDHAPVIVDFSYPD